MGESGESAILFWWCVWLVCVLCGFQEEGKDFMESEDGGCMKSCSICGLGSPIIIILEVVFDLTKFWERFFLFSNFILCCLCVKEASGNFFMFYFLWYFSQNKTRCCGELKLG